MPPTRDSEYKSRIAEAVQFFLKPPQAHTISWVATKFDIKYETLRRHISKLTSTMRKPYGGQNRVLTPAQDAAICQFIHDQLERSIPANRSTLLQAVADLRPGKEPPSRRWLQQFLKAHPEFHSIRTKALNTQRKQAQNQSNFEDFFMKYNAILTKYNIKPCNLWNFDETGYIIGCYQSTDVIVPVGIKQVS